MSDWRLDSAVDLDTELLLLESLTKANTKFQKAGEPSKTRSEKYIPCIDAAPLEEIMRSLW